MALMQRALALQPPPVSAGPQLAPRCSAAHAAMLQRRSSSHCLVRRQQQRAARCTAAAEAPSPPSPQGGAAASPGAVRRQQAWTRRKQFDVVALSNLCVDIAVHTPELPPADEASRRALLRELTARPPPQEQWEVGGNTNLMIASARLGLRVASVGHLGDDVYGRYMRAVLQAEGIAQVEPVATQALSPELDQTLLCFVLLAPGGKHSFCSRYDFGPWPLLPFVAELPAGVTRVLEGTEALFINGFCFDELSPAAVLAAARTAADAGAAVFFDPGPRSWTFAEGERKAALEAVLDAADVVTMTQDEAAAITGLQAAEAQAQWVLQRPGARTEWCVIKRGGEGALLATRTGGHVYTQRALQVDVADTVGCGDSFAAALVLGFTRGEAIPETMALANAVGAATAMGVGAGRNVASTETVTALLQSAVPDCADGRHRGALSVLSSALSSADFEDLA